MTPTLERPWSVLMVLGKHWKIPTTVSTDSPQKTQVWAIFVGKFVGYPQPQIETRCWDFPHQIIMWPLENHETRKPGCSVWKLNLICPLTLCIHTTTTTTFFKWKSFDDDVSNKYVKTEIFTAGWTNLIYCRGSPSPKSSLAGSSRMSRDGQLVSWICSAKFYAGNEKYMDIWSHLMPFSVQ